MPGKHMIAADMRRALELIHGRPLNRRERAVLAEFVLKAPIGDEADDIDALKSRLSHDLDWT